MIIDPKSLEKMVGKDIEVKEIFGDIERSVTGKLAKTPENDPNKPVRPFSVILTPKQDEKKIPYVPIPLDGATIRTKEEKLIVELGGYNVIPAMIPTVCCGDSEYPDLLRLYR